MKAAILIAAFVTLVGSAVRADEPMPELVATAEQFAQSEVVALELPPNTPPARRKSVQSLAFEAKERLDDLKCLMPGRLLGSINDPGAEVCVVTLGVNVCVLARRSSYYVSFAGRPASSKCDDGGS